MDDVVDEGVDVDIDVDILVVIDLQCVVTTVLSSSSRQHQTKEITRQDNLMTFKENTDTTIDKERLSNAKAVSFLPLLVRLAT